ncbi:MAG: ABC transporter substrate-binding subunit SaoX [Actinomycetota bacterium]|nr:MAG: NitT/TauT family transport system substrate-binding [Actinomycetota bacterium]MDO8950000.1 ABC transporter substrate-binding subunit SaoX [Actinomycetota bacterium]MDP3630207.1 ABC transporter substrate-binding subunit SaoX [Actinomycetota bacterium]
MRRLTALILVIGMLAVALAGCASADKKPTTEGTTPTEDMNYVVQLGYYGCDHMVAAAVARDAGIYDKLGIKVNSVGGGNVPEAMAAGKMDVGYVGTEGVVRAEAKGSPIFVAANNHLGGSFYIVISSKLKDVKDLVGKRFGIAPDADKNDSYWVRMAADAGIPASPASYKATAIGGSDAYIAVKNGQLDGFVDCDPWCSASDLDGSGKIVPTEAKLPNGEYGSCCVYSMNRKFQKEHPELAKKMILAHSLAVQYIYENPLEAAKIFAKEKGIDEKVALRTIYMKTNKDGRTLTWKIEPERFKAEFDYAKSVVPIDVPPIAEWLDSSTLDAAGTKDFDTFIKENVDPKYPLGMTYEDWLKAIGA